MVVLMYLFLNNNDVSLSLLVALLSSVQKYLSLLPIFLRAACLFLIDLYEELILPYCTSFWIRNLC